MPRSTSCTLEGIDGLHAVGMMGERWVFALCLGCFFWHFRVAFCGFGAGVFFVFFFVLFF